MLGLILLLGADRAWPAACAPPPQGLVSWWQAESNALDHVGGNHGALSNGVGYAAGMVGEAFVFNGTNSYVEVPDSPSLQLTNELTIECWVKLLDLQAENYLVNKGGDWTRGALDYGMTITQPLWNNVLGFAFAGGSRHSVSITDLNWHHVAVTARNGDADPTFYVDGVQQPVTLRDGADTIYLYPSTEPLRIGAQVDPLSGWFFYSKAVVDELSIYSRVLTAVEIQAVFNAGSAGKCPGPTAPCAPLSAGLVSWWQAETNALDAVGANNGSLTNGAGFAPGMVGPAFSFNDSSNSYVEVPDSPTLRFTNALTLECWAKRLNTSEVHALVEKGGDWTGGQTDFEMALNDTYDGGSHFGFAFAGGWRGCAVTPDTAWHHYAAVAVSGQADPILYVDGVPQAIAYSGGSATMYLSATTRPLHIGAQLDAQTGWFYYSSTMIDELAIYNRALAAAEIQAIYNAGSAGKCAAPTPPAILLQPTSQIVTAGSNASFSVLAAGTPPLSYQWQFNGTNLASATASSLALTDLQPADAGSYSVLVSNSVGTVLSSNAILTVSAPPCAPVPSGLIGWWKGDGNGMDSAGTNNAYALINVSFTNGIVGQAFACDPESYPYGTYNGIQIADQPAYALTNSLSIETWIRPRGDGYNIFWRGDNRPGLDPYSLGMQGNNTVGFVITDANGNSASVSAPLAYNQWWYVAATLDGASGTLSLYTNGTLAAQISTRVRPFGALIPQDSPGIGIGNVNDGFNNFPFTGDIDEVSLYSRALAAAEVQAIYNAGSAGKCVPPIPPSILQQPTGQIAMSGTNVSFSVLATGTQPLSYQWMLDGTNLAAATASSLGLTNVQLSDAGSYSVLVTNTAGTVLSSNAVLTVLTSPPCAPEPGGLVDWWRAQGNALDFIGANQGTLVGGVTYTQGEVGQAFVFDGNGSYIDFGTNVGNFGTNDFTAEFWLSTVSTRYEILLSKRNICNADNLFNILIRSGELLFEVDGGASSYGFFGVQDTRAVNDGGFHHAALVRQGPTLSIYVDGTLSSSGTLSSGQVADVSSAAHFSAGTCPCVGVDGTSSYTGALDEISLYSRALTPIEVQMLYAAGRSGKCAVPTGPVVLVSPTNLTVIAQSNAVFNVAVAGTSPLSYQWRFNSGELAGQTNPSLVLAAVSPNQAGSYDVVVTNAVGAVTSAVAVLTVYVPPPPGFTLQPLGPTVPAGTNVALTSAATNAWPISYQWYFGGTPLGGATSSVLNLTDVQAVNGGDYTVVAANAWNAATSTVATLTVVPAAPLLTLQPQSAGVFPGFQAQLSAAAAGTEPLAYQWQWYGTNIPAATNASYVVSNMMPANVGPYQVTVSNSAGGAPSAQALLVMAPVACWGSTPIGLMSLPLGVTNAVAVSVGTFHNLALRRDGAVVAWGAADQISVPAGLANAVAISAGGDHSLALKADGSVAAWGANSAGQANVPANLSNVVAIAAGASHSLALKADGTVAAWGLNASGQTSVPATLTNVIAISAGSNHSIALRADGTVFAWGSNTSGQTNVPASLADVVAIAAGASHNLALRSDGTVTAWGSSAYGQTNVPAGLTGVVAIGAGAFHSLAVKSDGTMVAWGAGISSVPSTFPNLGQSYIPPTVTNMVAASGGQAHTLALAGDGPPFITAQPVSRARYSGSRVVFRAAATGALPLSYQWQYNGNDLPGATSQLLVMTSATNGGSYRVVVTNLLGAATSAPAMLSLVDGPPLVTVQPVGQPAYLGVQELLQVTADGSGPLFYQWRLDGTNIAGATGSSFLLNHLQVSDAGSYSVVVSNAFGAVSSAKVVVPIIQTVAWGAGTNYGAAPSSGQSMVPAGLINAVAVAGGGYHSLALKADTKVLAWGAGATNTGIAPNYGQSIVPGGLAAVAGIAGGLYHSLAVTANGSVSAWGAGTAITQIGSYGPNYGQCIVPASASNVIAVAASDYDSFALRSDGKVVGWGESIYSITNIPATATNVIAIAARGSHVLAMRSDGIMVHWGNQTSLPPTPYNYVAIAAGVNHCLALRSDGTVVSWGGQYAVPSGLANVVDIAAGYDHSVALRSDGTVVTWGATNTYGRNLIPTGLTNVVGIACGYYNSLAVLSDGTPLIKVQPANRVAFIATSTNFVAMAVGAQPLHFQWQFNGTNLLGATSSSFTLANVQAPSAGRYRVVVTNVFGAVTSSVATLTALVPLGQALNASSLVWSTSGNAAWFGESTVTHDGLSAAQSGSITDSQTSTLQTTVVGAGTGTFWWKVSSEQWFDYLSFYIDGVLQASVSGDTGWQQQAFAVANGSHALKWTYAKDPSVSAGADAGWLDQVTFVPNPPVITLQPLSQHGAMGSALTVSVAATGAPLLSYQWSKDGATLSGATSAAFTIACATRRDSGVYQVLVGNPGGNTPSSNATLVVRSPQRLGPPLRLPGGGIALTSGDADGGALLPGDLPNFQVQASTNFVDWVALLNALTVTNGMLYLVDPDSTNYSVSVLPHNRAGRCDVCHQPARHYRPASRPDCLDGRGCFSWCSSLWRSAIEVPVGERRHECGWSYRRYLGYPVGLTASCGGLRGSGQQPGRAEPEQQRGSGGTRAGEAGLPDCAGGRHVRPVGGRCRWWRPPAR